MSVFAVEIGAESAALRQRSSMASRVFSSIRLTQMKPSAQTICMPQMMVKSRTKFVNGRLNGATIRA